MFSQSRSLQANHSEKTSPRAAQYAAWRRRIVVLSLFTFVLVCVGVMSMSTVDRRDYNSASSAVLSKKLTRKMHFIRRRSEDAHKTNTTVVSEHNTTVSEHNTTVAEKHTNSTHGDKSATGGKDLHSANGTLIDDADLLSPADNYTAIGDRISNMTANQLAESEEDPEPRLPHENEGPINYLYTYSYAPGVDELSIGPSYDYVRDTLFTPWSEWKAKCGNGVCEEGEWCRTCPQDCPCTKNCGNGLCEDGENGDTCPEDCTHDVSVCGNGKCDNSQGNITYWIYRYENKYNCPQDCPLDEVCGNAVCDPSESCWTCAQDCGECAPTCGDGRCNGGETCKSCARDCGYCDAEKGNGVCDWPILSLEDDLDDCKLQPMKNYTYEGVMYATIDNADPKVESYSQSSCSTKGRPVPPGWTVAVLTPRLEAMFATGDVGFAAGCAVLHGGVSRPINGKGTDPDDCEDNFIQVQNVDGVDLLSLNKDFCPSRILLQSIESSLATLDQSTTRSCPFACSGHGQCNVFTGLCSCAGRYTGPGCERIIGDLQIPVSTDTWYQPHAGVKWQWQLQEKIDMSFDVPLYDVDFDTSAATISKLHAQGRKVVCYFSAGSWENFRVDEKLFDRAFMGGALNFGEGDDFQDERWLDLRRMDGFAMLMLNRIDMAKQKGCDGIEFDNPDVIIHDNGIRGKITLDLQLIYNKWLVAQSHARGIAVALKNSNEFASYLYKTYDMVVNEECWVNGNCDNYWPFINSDKPVLNCEYFTARCAYCDRSLKMNMSTIKKVPDLLPCRVDCYTPWDTEPCEQAKFPLKYPEGDWCETSRNELEDECPADRFASCDPNIGY